MALTMSSVNPRRIGPRKVLGVKWEDYWETPLDEVRRMIGVTVEQDAAEPAIA